MSSKKPTSVKQRDKKLWGIGRGIALAYADAGAPGFIEVERFLKQSPDYAHTISKVPLARMGVPQDVGDLARFLASYSSRCRPRHDRPPKLRRSPRISFSRSIAFFAATIGLLARRAILAGERLYVHVLEQADPHHMGNAACIVPIAFILLKGSQESFVVARLDAEDGEASFCQSFKKPLRQRSCLNAHPLQAECRIAQDGYKVLRMSRPA
jgi:hypothetical protein